MALAGACAVVALWAGVATAKEMTPGDLARLSIEELGQVQVTSVSKRAEALSDAPSAVYVITHDDILRSGATQLPQALRLAPNLMVAETAAGQYVVTARGFSGSSQAQSFSNKLLVLIDGRSVYTPLFSGVYWDMQDVDLADVDRIEVISGPGATLWGANAVNGVINIITRSSADTQGGLVRLGYGDRERILGARYGGTIHSGLTWRAYVKAFKDEGTRTAGGADAGDSWYRPQAGFRLDWAASDRDAVTLEGDGYWGSRQQGASPDETISGRNLTARWTRAGEEGAQLQVQGYYDRTGRKTDSGGGSFWVDTYDLDVQDSFTAGGGAHQIVLGGGVREAHYIINGSAGLQFQPPSRTLGLVNLFGQDSITLTDALTLTVGTKFENDPYAGLSVLPSVRLAYRPNDPLMLWAAVSRAIRSPTPFDRDVVEKVAGITLLAGDPAFTTEKLTAYETGVRFDPGDRMSLSVSGFYNVYDDLRSIEPTGSPFPLLWGNGMRGDTYGVEAWGALQALAWWRLSAGLDVMHESLGFQPGASGFFGVRQAGDDPHVQAQLRSSMDLGPRVQLDATLRHVGRLPDPAVPAYTELNLRLAWNVTDHVQLAVTGFNLLHDRHREFPSPASAVPRSLLAELQWRF
jgi:iron complex outermembrane receptor protein